MKNRTLIGLLFLTILLVSSCHQPETTFERPSEKTSKGVYRRWDPSHALADANNDIANENIRVYLHGGIAAMLVGVDSEDYDLVKDLPCGEAGVGCIVSDMKLRSMQGKYATIYNKRIVEWIKATGYQQKTLKE